ncbi:MAG TPA: DUF1800 domain-containing protein [Stellaceae bacterium]|nr:DUF1800 domain-containing protein [Stellaceae bacterium]
MPASITAALMAACRFGFAPKPRELAAIAGDPRGWVSEQIARRPDPLPEGLPPSQRTVAMMLESRRDKEEKPALKEELKKIYLAELDARMRAAILGDAPVLERLTQFWSNHFTVSAMRPFVRGFVGAFEREAIRPHVTGRFVDMLLAVTRHPTMLLYLDNAQSFGPDSPAGQRRSKGLNENLGRELLELHTLGVDGGYGQADVEALARILTGWTVTPLRFPDAGSFRFFAQIHEPGAKTLLGRVYREGGIAEGEQALRDLAAHPATARHVATKLARHFIADTPPVDAVQRIARVFHDTGGDLRRVTLAVAHEEAAWREPLGKVRTPNELVISAYRVVGEAPKPGEAFVTLKNLDQPAFLAPSPAGWPDVASVWVSPESTLRRIEWAQTFAQRLPDPPDPVEVMADTFGDMLPEELQQAVRRAPDKRMALALLVASPQFQRR